jgi:hypothetical protein
VSDYTPDQIGMIEFLNSDFMIRVVEHVGTKIMHRAMATAPVGDPVLDEHPGRYASSFMIETHRLGGATSDRAEAIVSNYSAEAKYVEYGHRGREPYHTLLRAAMEERYM